MDFVSGTTDIRRNIIALERLRTSSIPRERQEYVQFIRRGHNFVWTHAFGKRLFAPSRFAGYRNNTVDKHRLNDERHGGKTDKVLSRWLRGSPRRHPPLEAEFRRHCDRYDIPREKRNPKFWERGV
jgi:hypothetical protein